MKVNWNIFERKLIVISLIILNLNFIYFFIVWVPCFFGTCDIFGKLMLTFMLFFPILFSVILVLIILWLIHRYKK